jgi:hypothetical protein
MEEKYILPWHFEALDRLIEEVAKAEWWTTALY